MKKIILMLGILLNVSVAFAQQEALYTQYMFNGLVLNPAYAGNKGLLNVNIVDRDQWAGQNIGGAPKTQALTADAVLNDGKVGLGLHVINDKLGAQSQLSAMASYAYRIPMGNTTLSFGLSAGVANYKLDGTQLTYQDGNDQAIPETSITNLTPDFSAGIYLSHDKYYIGLSSTHLFNIKHAAHFADYINMNRHYYFNAGYIWTIDNALKFYPSTLVRSDFKGPVDVDLNAIFLIYDRLGLGGTYRVSPGKDFAKNSAVGMMQLYMFKQTLRLGYSYDFDVAKFGVPRNSHEISVGYLISGKKDFRTNSSPRYY